MDDVKDKMKGIFKKVNKTLSSSSGNFQGQGRVLGSATDTREQPIVSPLAQRFSAPSNSRPNPPKKNSSLLNPCEPLNSSGKKSTVNESTYSETDEIDARDRISGKVGEFVSCEPPKESIDVVLRIMRNVAREPGNDKFRRIRLGNPKIKQAVVDVNGAMELLKSVGFVVEDEEGETWGKMGFPEEKQLCLINEALILLERWSMADSIPDTSAPVSEKSQPNEKIDRQVSFIQILFLLFFLIDPYLMENEN